MVTRLEVDGASHVAAVTKLFAKAQSADELLEILLDVVVCTTDGPLPRFPFGYDLAIAAERQGEWRTGFVGAILQAAAVRRRGKFRGMARPQAPVPGTLWQAPRHGSMLVLCSTPSGLVFCAPVKDARWRLELLLAFAVEDFEKFELFTGKEEAGETNPASTGSTEEQGGGDYQGTRPPAPA